MNKLNLSYFKGIRSLSILMLFCSGMLLNAQKTEIDITISGVVSKPKFHHDKDLDTDARSFDDRGMSYALGIRRKLSENWGLRTELGFMSINSFVSISYDYNEGFGPDQRSSTTSWLNNQKIYMGIFPEYRFYFKKDPANNCIDFLLGPIFSRDVSNSFSRDVSNSFSRSNEVLRPYSSPLGVRIGGAISLYQKEVGVKIGMYYTQFDKSMLQNRYHPHISYSQFNGSLTIVYHLD